MSETNNSDMGSEVSSTGPPQWLFNEMIFLHPIPPSALAHLPQLVLLHTPRLAAAPPSVCAKTTLCLHGAAAIIP